MFHSAWCQKCMPSRLLLSQSCSAMACLGRLIHLGRTLKAHSRRQLFRCLCYITLSNVLTKRFLSSGRSINYKFILVHSLLIFNTQNELVSFPHTTNHNAFLINLRCHRPCRRRCCGKPLRRCRQQDWWPCLRS